MKKKTYYRMDEERQKPNPHKLKFLSSYLYEYGMH